MLEHACFASGFAVGFGLGVTAGAGCVFGALWLVFRLFKLWTQMS
jgi:hypothetical protein